MCKISIISPVYNSEKFLDKCIQSILSQDLEDFEAIFVNDGSTDNSLEILNSYKEKDSRIKVFSKENEGQGVARNIALPLAKGDYILYLDPDDWLEEGALSKIYNKFQEDNYDIIFFNIYNYYENTGIKNQFLYNDRFYSRFKENIFSVKNASEVLFETNGQSFKAYNREFLIKNDIKYSPTKYIEDSEFFIKAVLYAEKMVCLNECIVNYRIHDTLSRSQTHKNIEVIRKTFYVCEKILKEYCNNNPELRDNLTTSFLKNRTVQLYCHFSRTEGKYKKEYFYMMKEIFNYINENYNNGIAYTTTKSTQVKYIQKYNWLGYCIAYKLHLLKIFLPEYCEI